MSENAQIHRWQERLQKLADTMDTPQWSQSAWLAMVDEMHVENPRLGVLRSDMLSWVRVTVYLD